MPEAVRKEYRDADSATVDELKERYRHLAREFEVVSDNARFNEFVGLASVAWTSEAQSGGVSNARSVANLQQTPPGSVAWIGPKTAFNKNMPWAKKSPMLKRAMLRIV